MCASADGYTYFFYFLQLHGNLQGIRFQFVESYKIINFSKIKKNNNNAVNARKKNKEEDLNVVSKCNKTVLVISPIWC